MSQDERTSPRRVPPGERTLVAIGGGSGLAVLLRGLKSHFRSPRHLAAVVTVADDGGSSGRLRRELGVLPPGDIRNCLVALADDEDLLAQLLEYRFDAGVGLEGHSFGNLFLTALAAITGDLYRAVRATESVLSVRGRILPATLSHVELRAVGRSGRPYRGESAIGRAGEPLRSLVIEPADVEAFPEAVATLEEADLIVLGPGSLYTSILPNLLIPGIRDAVRRSPAPAVLVLNLMTQPGETDHMDAVGHLAAVRELAGEGLLDVVLANSTAPDEGGLALYAEAGAEMVALDDAAIREHGVELVEADLLAAGELIRHDPEKLARALCALAARDQPPNETEETHHA